MDVLYIHTHTHTHIHARARGTTTIFSPNAYVCMYFFSIRDAYHGPRR